MRIMPMNELSSLERLWFTNPISFFGISAQATEHTGEGFWFRMTDDATGDVLGELWDFSPTRAIQQALNLGVSGF